MESVFELEFEIVQVLAVVLLVAMAVRRIRLPYTVALVGAGLVLAFRGGMHLELTPGLVLGLFVPPLIFEAAFHLQLKDLKADLTPIAAMAVPGVLISTGIIAAVLVLAGVLPLPAALIFGALISATDPVAVVATFRSVGAPKRLLTLVEGESLFNDGTAVVIFHIMLALAVEGTLNPLDGVVKFVTVSVGGILIGGVLGYAVAKLIEHIDDYLIEVTLTTILAYGSFILAEQFHFSGVLAVVVAGLVNGNIGPRGMTPSTKMVLFTVWEYIAFLANSFIFILLGISVEWEQLVTYLTPSLIAVAAVLGGRFIVVYLMGGAVRLFRHNLPAPFLLVMSWGGLRGAISVALALSLPADIANRPQLLAMTFAVVLFTILVQALSISGLLSRLGLTQGAKQPAEYERIQGQLLAIRSAINYVDRLYRGGALIPTAYTTVKAELTAREENVSGQIDELLNDQPDLREQIVSLARTEALRAERTALDELSREGILGEEALIELQAELDEAIYEAETEGSHA
ncbi:MAG: Na+/H+ antiporter [Caldilineaceae bacterium SB0670_bin_27]|nr:Na+/H+ antiporter [Caldilineaceae bacterium SB0670_bin_27]